MIPAYPQWPSFPLPFAARRPASVPMPAPKPADAGVPDHPSQLEELLSHVRRCEKWAALDDRLDLWMRNQGRP